MIWVRDRRFWGGPTYSTIVGEYYLYYGVKNWHGEGWTFGIYKGLPSGSLDRNYHPREVIYPEMQYKYECLYFFTTDEEARIACEKMFEKYQGVPPDNIKIEIPELCPECYTRHKPHENEMCEL